MRELSNRGVAIIMIFLELPEILGMCDRIAVMRSRRIVTFLNKEQANQESIIRYAARRIDIGKSIRWYYSEQQAELAHLRGEV